MLRRVSFLVTDEMYLFLKERARVFGSISGYVRHLVMNDMCGGGVVVRRVSERVVEDVAVLGPASVRPPPPCSRPAPPSFRTSGVAGGTSEARLSGYGSLHAELLSELKARLSSVRERVESEKVES
ncbi:MAG: hypothetical protein QXE92_02625 [Thermofilaceae archaeon]